MNKKCNHSQKFYIFFLRNFELVVIIMYELNEHNNMSNIYRKKVLNLNSHSFFYNNLSFQPIHVTALGKKKWKY